MLLYIFRETGLGTNKQKQTNTIKLMGEEAMWQCVISAANRIFTE